MYEARWKDNPQFSCYSNTIRGAMICLASFIPKDEKGLIFIYLNDKLVAKHPVR